MLIISLNLLTQSLLHCSSQVQGSCAQQSLHRVHYKHSSIAQMQSCSQKHNSNKTTKLFVLFFTDSEFIQKDCMSGHVHGVHRVARAATVFANKRSTAALQRNPAHLQQNCYVAFFSSFFPPPARPPSRQCSECRACAPSPNPTTPFSLQNKKKSNPKKHFFST
jgi:hypothetical protein